MRVRTLRSRQIAFSFSHNNVSNELPKNALLLKSEIDPRGPTNRQTQSKLRTATKALLPTKHLKTMIGFIPSYCILKINSGPK